MQRRALVMVARPTPAVNAPYHFLRDAAEGLMAHGYDARLCEYSEFWTRPAQADLYVLWGERQYAKMSDALGGAPFKTVIMDRPYLNRSVEMDRCRIGARCFGEAFYAHASASPRRYYARFQMPSPPRCAGRPLRRDVLVMAQVRKDMAIAGSDFAGWAGETVRACERAGLRPAWRTHPHDTEAPTYTTSVHRGTLADALGNFDRMVTFSSGSAIDGIMEGLDVRAMDPRSPLWGAVPFDVASEPVSEIPFERLFRLANCEWWRPELVTGEAFEGLV